MKYFALAIDHSAQKYCNRSGPKTIKYCSNINKVLHIHYCTFLPNSIAIIQYFNSEEFYQFIAINVFFCNRSSIV